MSKVTDQLYVEYTFTVTPLEPWNDVLAAQLGAIGFESFMETDNGLLAYVQKDLDHDTILNDLEILQNDFVDIAFAKAEIPPTNWNHEWESNFEPIMVDDRCEVRAPFHEKHDVDYDIVIEPKMSFGTGHHQTTYMMMEHLLELDFTDTKVLDMGSGTGVLAILAQMRGAVAVDAVDIDTWCYENALENVQRNNADKVEVILGGAEVLQDKYYDIIIANINRNILLTDIPTYAKCLSSGGKLLLSGFYEEDLEAIKSACLQAGMEYLSHRKKDNWIAPIFLKK
ncbi:[LSU ribosomal protein L11P]-lysine N-methyltransferase [Nonlabens sp. Hel1_33_55]|uniref:50S ribosomal protein L11 methyltransferase n=1 Tax=Nonlabens sp. Hel1_33_55 TaxID=1336802 RepID=UPI000875B18E|nr:50S ribosomal protein L11 methyltransferase [Nonlabens sp. Hel1_33_55]SCX93435.1 [LSU ribosomal protein L11P]-lysine N-methyltransferase [Nonlabens sp. Hel1_33_55]